MAVINVREELKGIALKIDTQGEKGEPSDWGVKR